MVALFSFNSHAGSTPVKYSHVCSVSVKSSNNHLGFIPVEEYSGPVYYK
jgi:hypothetical protein